MPGVYTLIGFAAQLKAIEHDMNALGPAIVARACEMVFHPPSHGVLDCRP